MNKILLTGGAGFIGSHVFEKLAHQYPSSEIIILDKMTYAADYENISRSIKSGQRVLTVGDVCDFTLCKELTKNVDIIFHLAAESHVDNSFGNSLVFSTSNTLGSHTLLEAARLNEVPLFIHVSTDEVYGEISEGSFNENDVLNPTNPYSASKASADMFVNSYRHSFNMPIITVRANNIYGVRQYPEKIIPKLILQMIRGNKLTLHGTGQNVRHYLSARDFADALILVAESGNAGEIYNIGSSDEYKNIEIAEMICEYFESDKNEKIVFIEDRPFNDSRYSIDFNKLKNLGWVQNYDLRADFPSIIQWYKENAHRYSDVVL